MSFTIRVKDATTFYGETLSLSDRERQGFWLYDTTRKMNLAIRAKSKDEAFVEALLYYQRLVVQLTAGLSSAEEKVQKILEVLGAEEIDEDAKEFIRNYR